MIPDVDFPLSSFWEPLTMILETGINFLGGKKLYIKVPEGLLDTEPILET